MALNNDPVEPIRGTNTEREACCQARRLFGSRILTVKQSRLHRKAWSPEAIRVGIRWATEATESPQILFPTL